MATGTILVVASRCSARSPCCPRCSRSSATASTSGRIPFLGKRMRRAHASRASGRRSSTASCGARWSRPCSPPALLVALAIPALGMHTAQLRHRRAPAEHADHEDATTACRRRSRATQTPPSVVVKADDVTTPEVAGRDRARSRRSAAAHRRRDRRRSPRRRQPATSTVAIVDVPIAGNGTDAKSVRRAGARCATTSSRRRSASVDGAEVVVGGDAAAIEGLQRHAEGARADRVRVRPRRWRSCCCWSTFRSIVIPIKAIVLNLLSVGAAYGVLVAGLPARAAARRCSASRRTGAIDAVAAAVPVRDPVRPVDGLPRVHPQPDPRGVRPRHDDRGRRRARHQARRPAWSRAPRS